MGQLDSLVTDALVERILDPAHLTALVSEIRADTEKSKGKADTDRQSIEHRFKEADLRVSRLFDALENGTVTDSDTFRARLSKAQGERQEALRLMTEAQRRATDAQAILSPKKVAVFSHGIGELLRTGDIRFRKAYLRAFVSNVELLDGEVRISGSKEVLNAALEAGLPPPGTGVPTLVQEWRARRDSNP